MVVLGVSYVLSRTSQVPQTQTVHSTSFGLSAGGTATAAAPPAMITNLDKSQGAVGYNAESGMASDVAGAPTAMRAPMPPSPALAPEPTQEKRLIIQTGQMSVVVHNVSSTIDAISALAVKNGGYVVEKNFYKSDSAPSGYVTVRIPATSFEQGLGAIRALGDVVSESLSGNDVTAEYVDLNSQLRNLRSSETQLLEIMKRSGTISDVLEVQNQLTSIRGQIESLQGRTKYLEQSAAYSLLTVNLSTDASALPIVEKEGVTWKPLTIAKTALRSLVDLGKSVVEVIIWFLVYLPLWILIGLAIWLLVRKLWPYILKRM